MFNGWVDGQTKFRVESMSVLSFTRAWILASVAAFFAAKQLVDGKSLMLFDTAADSTERKNHIKDRKYSSDLEELSRKLLTH